MKKLIYTIIVIFSLILSLTLLETTKTIDKSSDYDLKVEAAELMQEAGNAIKEERISRNHSDHYGKKLVNSLFMY